MASIRARHTHTHTHNTGDNIAALSAAYVSHAELTEEEYHT